MYMNLPLSQRLPITTTDRLANGNSILPEKISENLVSILFQISRHGHETMDILLIIRSVTSDILIR